MKKQLTWGGIAVPYVTRWSSEQPAFVRADRYAAGLPSVFYNGSRGVAKPLSGQIHAPRQRECASKGLCRSCALPLHSFFAIHQAELIVGADYVEPMPLLDDSASCARCMVDALAFDPLVFRQKSMPGARFLELREFEIVPQWIVPKKGIVSSVEKAVNLLQLMVRKAECYDLVNFNLRLAEHLTMGRK